MIRGAAIIWMLATAALAGVSLDDVPEIDGKATEEQEEEESLTRLVTDELKHGMGVDILARRIMSSSIWDWFTDEEKEGSAEDQVIEWIEKNPGSAAYLKVGFAKDDIRHEKVFEEALKRHFERFFEVNPDLDSTILGRLDRIAQYSKKLAVDDEIEDQDRGRLIKKIFEGESTIHERLEKEAPPDFPSRAPTTPAAFVDDTFYNRFSAENLQGYSPDIITMQSELNRKRPPGAPELVPTGRIDHETLRFPYYQIAHDLERLEATLRAQRAYMLAKQQGKHSGKTADDFRDPKFQAELERAAKGRDPSKKYARRRNTLARARQALAEFDREAMKTKDPGGITSERLGRLAHLRREATRWITVASMEETITAIERLHRFMDQRLRLAISKVPADKEIIERYKKVGEILETRVAGLLKQLESAADLLSTSNNPKDWERAQSIHTQTRNAFAKVASQIELYRDTPFAVLEKPMRVKGWRDWIEDIVLRWMPESGWSKRIKARRLSGNKPLAEFKKIAETEI